MHPSHFILLLFGKIVGKSENKVVSMVQKLGAIYKKLTPSNQTLPGVDFINSFTLYAKLLRSALNFYA